MSRPPHDPLRLTIYFVAFVTGAIVMGFEMLGSRYLNPYFGSGIYTWASLISTVLAALAAGYFCGGYLADRSPSGEWLGLIVVLGSAYLVVLPLFADAILETVLANVESVKLGSLISSLAIMSLPVALLGMYSPYAIRLLLESTQRSGTVSGMVYGISTVGSIVGTLGTSFYLIAVIGSRAITIALGCAGMAAGLLLILAARRRRKLPRAAALAAAALLGWDGLALSPAATADDFLDAKARAAVLAQPNGQIAHIETEYNDIFITKNGTYLVMAFQRYRATYTESATNLTDPEDLPVPYTQTMTLGALHPETIKRALMIGLGGGAIPTYLPRYIPDLAMDTAELDPGVVAAAKKYFGVRETSKVRFIESDGRVYLVRNREPYDLILVDAFRGGYVPFHLLTQEFYQLVKQRLAPHGAAVFNIHSGTKLYPSTLVTLRAVFPTIYLYGAEGNVIAIATSDPPLAKDALQARAAAADTRYRFHFPLAALLSERMEWPAIEGAEILTDDFAPANLYDAIVEKNKRQW